MFDKNDLLEAMAEKCEKQIENGAIDCPTEKCGSNSFDAEVWVSDGGGFEGAAVCRECNERIEFNFEDSNAKDSVKSVEKAVKDLEDSFKW